MNYNLESASHSSRPCVLSNLTTSSSHSCHQNIIRGKWKEMLLLVTEEDLSEEGYLIWARKGGISVREEW